MVINYRRKAIMVCLIIVNAISTVVFADQIWIKVNDAIDPAEISLDIAKKIPTIRQMIDDIGLNDNSKDTPLMLNAVDEASFKYITILLEKVDKKSDDNESELDAIKRIMSSEQCSDLLSLITASNFLDLHVILDASIKLFISSSRITESFHDLIGDVKKLIIEKLTAKQFLMLMDDYYRANSVPEEDSFKIALEVHYQQRISRRNANKAKDRYYELYNLGGFVYVPGGDYKIGSRKKRRDIKLSPFFVMNAVVTQDFYAMKTRENPSYFKEKEHCPESFQEIEVKKAKIGVCIGYPVDNVSHDNAMKFAELLSSEDSKHTYSLATEGQLEVAFRGGTMSSFVTGRDDIIGLEHYVWYNADSCSLFEDPNICPHPAKSKLANAFGIYLSPIREWAKDWYSEDYIGSTGLDPQGPSSGNSYVIRGGHFDDGAYEYKSHSRKYYYDGKKGSTGHRDVGFRLVRIKHKEGKKLPERKVRHTKHKKRHGHKNLDNQIDQDPKKLVADNFMSKKDVEGLKRYEEIIPLKIEDLSSFENKVRASSNINEAILAAQQAISSNNLTLQSAGVRLFAVLVSYGHAIVEATQGAQQLMTSTDNSVLMDGLYLFQGLASEGHAINEVIEACQKIITTNDDASTQRYAILAIEIIVKQKKGLNEAAVFSKEALAKNNNHIINLMKIFTIIFENREQLNTTIDIIALLTEAAQQGVKINQRFFIVNQTAYEQANKLLSDLKSLGQ